MKAFMCAFEGFHAAIPMDSVSSLSNLSDADLPAGARAAAVTRDAENGIVYVSLPALLGRPLDKIRHGVSLKESDSHGGNKIVLLGAEITSATEIPDGEMRPIPRSLEGTELAELFRGARCDGGLVLLLDAERLALRALRETAG